MAEEEIAILAGGEIVVAQISTTQNECVVKAKYFQVIKTNDFIERARCTPQYSAQIWRVVEADPGVEGVLLTEREQHSDRILDTSSATCAIQEHMCCASTHSNMWILEQAVNEALLQLSIS